MRIRKKLIVMSLVLIGLAGCGESLDYAVETAPSYQVDKAYPFIIAVTNDDGDVTGMDIQADLEMKNMDHGTIEVDFADNGDGTYTSEVELPMAGEWYAHIEGELNGETYSDTVVMDVQEE